MSGECLNKPCRVCGRPIRGANFYCQRCKACICYYCGAEMMKEARVSVLKCPRCGGKLK